jgi:hypothetical protein
MRDAPPGLWALRVCCCRCRCSCSACIVAKICNCCAIKSDVFGLKKAASAHAQKKKSKTADSEQNIPHPQNTQNNFPTTNFLLLFLLSLAIFDRAQIPL